jgi:hypothetical protein
MACQVASVGPFVYCCCFDGVGDVVDVIVVADNNVVVFDAVVVVVVVAVAADG